LSYFRQYMRGMSFGESQVSRPQPRAEVLPRSFDSPTERHPLRRRGQQALLGAFLLFFPLVARAQEEAARYQQDPVEEIAARLVAALAVLGIVVVIASLLKYKGVALGPVAWGLLIGGAVALPFLVSGVGTILVFERAERVEFCESCHLTMQAFVDDMKNPKSNSLAALHYKNRYIPDNQCYACHTSYGLFGTVQAKKEGLHDVYHYYTRTFHLPIKLRHPYPNNDCLKCHAGSVKWNEDHQDYKDALFSGGATCMQCHADANPAHNVGHTTAEMVTR
jgi:cytochrome c nitrite reductase small subunit